jgi:hypothetical protein|tara:strand:+ start:689 stop:910 length:222 start_codon:yes stop_codon:yes gene_type:complete
MKIMELVGTPADQQGMTEPNKPATSDTKEPMGAEENPVVAARQKREQKKQIQDQIRATREQLKQLQNQLAAIR